MIGTRAVPQRTRDVAQIIIDFAISRNIIGQLLTLIGCKAVFFDSLILPLDHAQNPLSVFLILL